MLPKDTIYLYPYTDYSKSARLLARELGIKRIKVDDLSKFIDGPNKTLINWGRSNTNYLEAKIINPVARVALASNKFSFFNALAKKSNKYETPNIPEFTLDKEVAKEWMKESKLVLSRMFRGKGGVDIKFSDENIADFFKQEFFTVYIPKKEEYRVHIAFNNVICVQQKVLRKVDIYGSPIDLSKVNWRIRNHNNNFVFIKNNLHTPDDVLKQAKLAHAKIELDFGAYDVVYNELYNKAYVLEVNTAPGLEGTTVDAYANAFRENL